MVTRYLVRLTASHGHRFDVFSTGSAGWLLFCPVAGADRYGNGGYQTSLQIPVRRRDLRREIRRAIPHE